MFYIYKYTYIYNLFRVKPPDDLKVETCRSLGEMSVKVYF